MLELTWYIRDSDTIDALFRACPVILTPIIITGTVDKSILTNITTMSIC